MNNVIVGSAMLTAALIAGGHGAADDRATGRYDYEYTLRGNHGPDVESDRSAFVATHPAEIPWQVAQAAPSVEEAPAARSTATPAEKQPEFRVPARFVGEQKPGQLRASELIGMPVTGEDGTRIAYIRDLIVDENYNVTAVVLSTGGVRGIGGHKVAVPRYSVEIDMAQQDEPRASVPLSKADLEEAPEFRPLTEPNLLSGDGRPGRRPPADGAKPSERS